MVADEHGRAGRPLRIQATASVRQHDDIGPGTDGRAHPCTTWSAPWPSYKWVRPVKIAAILPVGVEAIRSVPP